MPDQFAGYAPSIDGPAARAFAIAPHDANELAQVTRALFVGGDGVVVCRLADDQNDVTLTGIAAGSILPLRLRYVRAAGTTATGLVGLA